MFFFFLFLIRIALNYCFSKKNHFSSVRRMCVSRFEPIFPSAFTHHALHVITYDIRSTRLTFHVFARCEFICKFWLVVKFGYYIWWQTSAAAHTPKQQLKNKLNDTSTLCRVEHTELDSLRYVYARMRVSREYVCWTTNNMTRRYSRTLTHYFLINNFFLRGSSMQLGAAIKRAWLKKKVEINTSGNEGWTTEVLHNAYYLLLSKIQTKCHYVATETTFSH